MSVHKAEVHKSDVVERVESFVAYGRPTCDVCYNQSPDERDDRAEFWPSVAIHYLRGDCSSAHEFWGVTLCEHHDRPQYHPEDATHRVFDEPKGKDDHHMNSAYSHNVTDVEVF